MARQFNSKKSDFQKSIQIEIPILSTGVTFNKRRFDNDSMIDIIKQLEEKKVFDILSVPVYISKSIINPSYKGSLVVGYVNSADEKNVTATIKGKYVDIVDGIEDGHIIARVVTDKEGKVVTILSFDIVPMSTIEDLLD